MLHMQSSIFIVTILVFLCDLTRLVISDEGHQIRSLIYFDQIHCSFDHDYCGFHQPDANHNFWERKRGHSPNNFTGPTCDRFDCRRGSYLYFNPTPRSLGIIAILESPVMQGTGTPHCLSFQYHMYGESMGFLNVKLRYINTTDSDDNAVYWTIPERDRGNKWHEKRYDISLSVDYKAIFEAVHGPLDTSDLAIDSIRIDRGSCSLYDAEYDWKCNFHEDENCEIDFYPPVGNRVYWNHTRISTPSRLTGPQCAPFDCGNGTYLYIDSSVHPRRSEAAFRTPILAGGGTTCLIMLIHMHGRGKLVVYIWNQLNGQRIKRWRIRGNQGPNWITKTVHFRSTWRYRIKVTAKVLRRGRSDTAIGFMRVKEGSCDVYRSLMQSDVYCSFDNNYCGFTQSLDDDANWEWNRFYTPTPGTGPHCHDRPYRPDNRSADSCRGKYIYVNANRLRRRKENGTAKIESPALKGGPRACLTFSYHMWGRDMGSLNVYKKDLIRGVNTSLWTVEHNQEDNWKHASIYFIPYSIYKIVFEARIGSSDRSDIAIDNVIISNATHICRPR